MNDKSAHPTENDRDWWRSTRLRVARAIHNPSDAEDYLHSAFLRLQEYRKTHAVNNPAAFLVRTAVNIAIDESRHRRVLNDTSPPISSVIEIPDDKPLQTEALVARERLRRVQEGLGKLPPRTRDIFVMHRVDGLKYREIAVNLGISVSAVEKQIAKAVLFLTDWTEGW